MSTALRLMCVTAHPDDESLGFGGSLARYSAEGVEVSLVVGTRGERGRFGDGSEPHPGPEALGRIREEELRAACEVLGVRHLRFLDYLDAELDRADPLEAADRVAGYVRELRPDVVLTFDPYGAYGHPDHIAISQLAVAGALRAASPASPSAPAASGSDREPHQVSKLYYMVWSPEARDRHEAALKKLRMKVDDGERASVAWEPWSVTTVIDARDHGEVVWEAIQCHRTQMEQYGSLTRLGPDDHRELWGNQEFYRVFSLVNGGRAREDDLFEGVRRDG